VARSGSPMSDADVGDEVNQSTYFVIFGLALVALLITVFQYPVWGY
jgi:hypothetical protein